MGAYMFFIDKYNTKIYINLENGLYIFSNQSSTGKTRLYKELKDMYTYGEDVLAYSYSDLLYGTDLAELLKKNPDKKVLLIDRYDMFINQYRGIIAAYSKHSIVMVDCKQEISFTKEDGMCFIEMTDNTISVGE